MTAMLTKSDKIDKIAYYISLCIEIIRVKNCAWNIHGYYNNLWTKAERNKPRTISSITCFRIFFRISHANKKKNSQSCKHAKYYFRIFSMKERIVGSFHIRLQSLAVPFYRYHFAFFFTKLHVNSLKKWQGRFFASTSACICRQLKLILKADIFHQGVRKLLGNKVLWYA